jgi:hypothetical protein
MARNTMSAFSHIVFGALIAHRDVASALSWVRR